MATILLTGGGTGGHVYPALALVPRLKKHFENIYFAGGRGIEREIVAQAGLQFFELPVVKFDRKNPFKNLAIPFSLTVAVKEAKKLLIKLSPDVVFGKGGYASLPAVLAALSLKIPVVCHESDVSLGLANRLAHALGAQIAATHQATAKRHKDFVLCGMPLREQLFSISASEAKRKIGCGALPVFMALGGSGGAAALNDIVWQALDKLCQNFFVVHIVGRRGGAIQARKNYLPLEYTNNIEIYYNAADYVLSRAGATAVAELSALNKRAIIVPLPKGASRGDQLENAELARELGAKVIFQHDFNAEVLLDALSTLNQNPPMRSQTADANAKIVGLLLEKAKTGGLKSGKLSLKTSE